MKKGATIRGEDISPVVAIPCCLMLIAYGIGAVIATVVALVDLTQGRIHVVFDAILLWLLTLPLVGSAFRSRAS